jgi:hypothetical protein
LRRRSTGWSPRAATGWPDRWFPLLAAGFVGGIDVGVGVLAYLVVDHETGQPLLGAAS